MNMNDVADKNIADAFREHEDKPTTQILPDAPWNNDQCRPQKSVTYGLENRHWLAWQQQLSMPEDDQAYKSHHLFERAARMSW